MRPFTKSESWPVVGFCPHVTSTGVFEINLSTLFPCFWSFKEVFSARTRQSDYITLSLSFSHRSSIILNLGEAPGIQKAELGALYTPKSDKADSSPKAEKNL